MARRTTRAVVDVAADTLGRLAFEAGRMAVPALDAAFCAHLRTLGNDHKAVITALDSWTRAWHRANLSTEIEL